VSNPVDADMRFGQIAVRMGKLDIAALPKLLKEARTARATSSEDSKPMGLGQVLVRRKLLSVSEYLRVAREVERSASQEEGAVSLARLGKALEAFESGTLDVKELQKEVSGEVDLGLPSREEVPPSFGRYELIAEIARGGMGIVYRARDTESGEIRALKVMIEADDDDARVARFEREAELAKALDHPGIVKVYDAGVIDGMPYFTMDLVEGKSFDDLLEEQVERTQAMQILAQVARAVDHAHKRGIVHRDLKPGNILVDAHTGVARVTDFGLARDMDRNTRITRIGQAVGTPYYMAPEQVRGERDVDGRADTYAIGVMLFELLTGDVPFDADSALSLFKKIDREPVVLDLDPERGIDAKIRAIAMRALEKNRDDRYASSKLLAEDLERYLKGTAPKARVQGATGELFQALSRNRRGVAIGGIVLLAVLSILIGAAAILSHVSDVRTEAAAAASARRTLELASDNIAKGEDLLASAPREAEARAREAHDLLRTTAELGTQAADSAIGRGVRSAFEANGPGETLRALALLGRAQRALDRPDEALASLDRACSVPGATPDFKLLMDLAALRREAGDLPSAIAALDSALAVRKESDPRVLIDRGEAKLGAGNADGAIQDLSLAMKEREDPAAPPEDRARPFLVRARAYLARAAKSPGPLERANFLKLADEDAHAATQKASQLAEPLLLQGDVERARRDLPGALAAYQTARLRDPNSVEPALRRGDALLGYGQLALAAAAYDAAIAAGASPGARGAIPWEAYYGRGTARAHLFALEPARSDLERVARLLEAGEPREPASAERPVARVPRHELARARAKVLSALAEVALARGDPGAARDALNDAVAADPTAAAPHAALASLALAVPDLQAASAELERARALMGKESPDADLLEVRARVALLTNDLPNAAFAADGALTLIGAHSHPRARRTSALVRLAQLKRSPRDEVAASAARTASDLAWVDGLAADPEPDDGLLRPDLATTLTRNGWRAAGLVAAYAAGDDVRLAAVAGNAEVQLLAAVRLDPLRAPAHLALAELRLARGRHEAAWKSAERCLEIDPYRARAHEVAALAFQQRLDVPELSPGERVPLLRSALAHADAALAAGETAPRRVLRARLERTNGDLAAALADAEAALALAPGDTRIEVLAAELRVALGRPVAKAPADIEKERAAERKRLGEILRTGTDDAKLHDAAEAVSRLGTPADPEVRTGLFVRALAESNDAARLELLATAVLPPDGTSTDTADRVLAAAAGGHRSDLADLLRRLDAGDEKAAVAVALAALEDALAGRRDDPRSALDRSERALGTAPGCVATWLTHALLTVRTGDPVGAEHDLAAIRELVPTSGLFIFIEAEIAAAQGDADRMHERLAAARLASFPDVDARTKASPILAGAR
jgi:tetratricopeptide (TPR) repeat protein/predicted Ser/Thr protein kinase